MAIVVPEQPVGIAAATPGRLERCGTCRGARSRGQLDRSGRFDRPDGCLDLPASPRRERDPADRARAGLIGGVVLIGLGGIFLIREFVPAFDFDLWWPTMLIGLGVLLVVVALVPTRHSS